LFLIFPCHPNRKTHAAHRNANFSKKEMERLVGNNTSPTREMRLDLAEGIDDWLLADTPGSALASPKRTSLQDAWRTWNEQKVKEEQMDDDVLATFNPIETDQPSDGLTPQGPSAMDTNVMDTSPTNYSWATMDPSVLQFQPLSDATQTRPIAMDNRKRKSVGGPAQGSLPISIKSTRSTTRTSATPVLGNSVGSMGRSATGKQQLNLLYGASVHSEILATSVASSHDLSGSTEDEFDGNFKSGDKRRKRRESHNAVERRRRDTINDKITELYEMLPDVLIGMEGSGPGQAAGSRPNKGIILTRSVEFLRWLLRTNSIVEARLTATETELRQLRTQVGLDPNGGILGLPDDRPILLAEALPGQAPAPRKRAGSIASTKSTKGKMTRTLASASHPGSDQYGTSPAASNLANALAASNLGSSYPVATSFPAGQQASAVPGSLQQDVDAQLLALLQGQQTQAQAGDDAGAILQALLKSLSNQDDEAMLK